VAEKMIRSHSPDILINPRYAGGILGQYETAENKFPGKRPHSKDWELCKSIRGGWGACRGGAPASGDPTVDVLATLAQCRSWDGNFLANVGPMPDGTMPEYFYNLCDELGAWMKHSKEALVGVKGGPWPEKSNVPVTRKGEETWYFFAWPQNAKGEFDSKISEQDDPTGYKYVPADKKIICSDMEKPQKATLLHNGKELKFEYKDKTLAIVIPAEMTTKLLDVVKVGM
jgi:alpha-L-fucosidase